MCRICVAEGLDRDCGECGGFNWVEDIYEWADDEASFMNGLCDNCQKAWAKVNGAGASA